MASFTMMIRGAILNVATSTGANYLTKYLSGDRKAPLQEKTQHDKVLERYMAAMARYMRDPHKAP